MTTKRPRRWLEINGKINVLSNHMEMHGYNRRRSATLAKRNQVKVTEIPLHVLSEFFGAKVTEVSQPDNWQEILYGSSRGAQRYVPKGKPKSTYKDRKEKEVERVSNSVARFMAMRLSRVPQQWTGYY